MLSGAEGGTRKVAAILDLLVATTSTQRGTIASTFTSTAAAVAAALANLQAAAPSPSSSEAARQHASRVALAGMLASAAVGGGAAGAAAQCAMWAVVALEAGLVGATFTSANYQTMTEPIDAVLAMPTGY